MNTETVEPPPLSNQLECPSEVRTEPQATSGIKHLEELIEEIQHLPESSRELAEECLNSVLQLHGEALGRILQLINKEGDQGDSIRKAMLRDSLLRAILLIHGLHPQSLETRLHEALDTVRPYMRSHGGSVELVSLNGESATLRFSGTCQGCPSSTITMELAIRRAVEEACPDLVMLELESSAPGKASER